MDLHGFTLEDVAVDVIEQTPIHCLDEKNILDAQAILKLTKITEALRKERESLSG